MAGLTITQLTGSILQVGNPQSFNVKIQNDSGGNITGVDFAGDEHNSQGISAGELPTDIANGDFVTVELSYDGTDEFQAGFDLGGFIQIQFTFNENVGDTDTLDVPYDSPPPQPAVYGFLTFTDPATLGQSNPYLLDLAYFNLPQYTWLVLNVGEDQTYAQLADSNPTSWNGDDNIGGDTPVGPLPPGTYSMIVTVTETDNESYWFGTQGTAGQLVSLIGPAGRSRTRRCSADLNIETYI